MFSDLDKVILELERFQYNFERYITDWSPVTNALALLKAQMPRVMTREEASETLMHGDFVIVEDRDTDMIWLGMRGEDNMELASGEYFDFDDLEKQDYRSEYGKSFRFWTSRPTPEQMPSTPWNVSPEVREKWKLDDEIASGIGQTFSPD